LKEIATLSELISTMPAQDFIDIVANDIDGDGKTELLLCNPKMARLSILDGSLNEIWSYSAPALRTVALADLDGDGVNEIILSGSAIHVLRASSPQEANKQLLIESLEDFKDTIVEKIDHDIESVAIAFTDVKDYWRAKRWADIFTTPLRVIEDALSLLAKAQDWSGIVTRADALLDSAEANYEIFCLFAMVQGLQEAGEKLHFGLDGPTYTSAIEAMLEEADATTLPPFGFDRGYYSRTIQDHLYGAAEVSPLVIPRKSTTVNRKNIEIATGALLVRSEISKNFDALITEVKNADLPEDFPMETVIAQIKNLALEVRRSKGMTVDDISYETYLQDGETFIAQNVETSLGAIGSLYTVFGQVAGNLDKKLEIETRTEIAKALSATGSVALLYTGTYKLEGVPEGIKVVQKVALPVELAVKALSKVFYGDAEDAFCMLPQEMVLSLPTELSNLWMIADDTDLYIRHLAQLETPPENIEGNDQEPPFVEWVSIPSPAWPFLDIPNPGVELQSGVIMVLKPEGIEGFARQQQQATSNRIISLLNNRLAQYGLKKTMIKRLENNDILVNIPEEEAQDPTAIRELMGRRGMLEFHKVVEAGTSPNSDLVPSSSTQEVLYNRDGIPYLVEAEPLLTGAALSDARVRTSQSMQNAGQLYIALSLNQEGAQRFVEALNRLNVGDRLAIALDNIIYSTPRITESIKRAASQGWRFVKDSVTLSGQLTKQEATRIAIVLRSGALPVPVKVMREDTVASSQTSGKPVSFTWQGHDNVTPADDLNYSYYLEGYDGSWSIWTQAREKIYENLPPNSYCFRVKAQDEGGNVSIPIAFLFVVEPVQEEEEEPEIPPAEPIPEPILVLDQLTRDKVAEFLSQHPLSSKVWSPIYIRFGIEDESKIRTPFEELKRQGYIDDYVHADLPFGRKLGITSSTRKGNSYLRDYSSKELSGQDGWVSVDTITVATHERVDIQVTGIRIEGSYAFVDYTWRYGQTTPVFDILRPILAVGTTEDFSASKKHDGEAYFALYDDGWRLANMWGESY
jgi:hypothetical protein